MPTHGLTTVPRPRRGVGCQGGKGSKIDKGHGPQTPEGLARWSRSSWKHGHYSAEAKAVKREARLHLKALRRLIAVAEQVIEIAPPTAKDWRSRIRRRAAE